MGYRNEFFTVTRGLGILTSIFEYFCSVERHDLGRTRGVLVSMCSGKTNGYACFNLQDRSDIVRHPGDEVYEGMIVGENSETMTSWSMSPKVSS